MSHDDHQVACLRDSDKIMNNKYVVNRILADKMKLTETSQRIRDDRYHRRLRSKTYLYLTPLISLIYLIPSSQMVLTEQHRARQTGNMEMCYLNYGCSRPYLIFDDINHIISNSGYIIFGLVFVALVRLKSYLLPTENRTDLDHLHTRGLLQQYSMFYCMGICMVLQGVFSAIFHTCPSNVSLQFDTTMMYIMLILVFVKIYQFRHPDISFNSVSVMYLFLVIITFEAMSLYISSPVYKILFYLIFSLVYIITVINIAVDCYFMGALNSSFPHNIPILMKQSFKRSTIIYPRRFILSLMLVLLNLSILIWILHRSAREGAQSLSSPILLSLSGLFIHNEFSLLSIVCFFCFYPLL